MLSLCSQILPQTEPLAATDLLISVALPFPEVIGME